MKNVAPELDLATFGGNLTIEETAVDFSDTQKAVGQIMGAYHSKAAGAERVLPVVTDASMAEATEKALDTLKLEEYVAP